MPEPLNADEPLPESEDVVYLEAPKSIALYLDATKWIVGLATGSFFLTGTILANRLDGGPILWLATLAIVSMGASAAFGVRALQCYTRLDNLIEVHAIRKAFEVSVRNDGVENVRYVTRERNTRVQDIGKWLKQSNFAYEGMTWAFGLGLLLYLVYAAWYLLGTRHP